MDVASDIPLAPLTTLGIGGLARWLARVNDVDELRQAIDWAHRHEVRLFILGGGSNLLISDAGFDGLVVQLDLRGVVVESEDAESVMVNVAASEPWDDFVAMAVERGWGGIECLSGIPGST